MTRTWPNLISSEGVRGMEWSKWSADAEPEHDVTLPFTRMFLGPMDYTPGAMLNATEKDFCADLQSSDEPWARAATNWRCMWCSKARCRCSPTVLQIICASRRDGVPLPVPTVWDETRVLDARIADTVSVARKKWRDWYVGAMNDWTARDLEVDFSFLPAGTFGWTLIRMASTPTARQRLQKDKTQITRDTKLKIKLAPGGGWAARVHPIFLCHPLSGRGSLRWRSWSLRSRRAPINSTNQRSQEFVVVSLSFSGLHQPH